MSGRAEARARGVCLILLGAIFGVMIGAAGRDAAWRDWCDTHGIKLVDPHAPKPEPPKPAPVIVDCDDCKGTGSVEGIPCPMCNQTGDFTTSKGEVHKGKCPLCLGTGKRIGECPICQGGGKLIQESPGILRNVPKKP